jgi:hypothetical protein
MARKTIPAAEEVQWMGLCPCGCGSFGWDREGWVAFTAGVIRQIDGESIDGTICPSHTAH